MKQQQRGGTLFYSCAASDNALCEQLARALRPLVREACLSEWADYWLPPGTDTVRARKQGWEDSTLILLLLSPNYLASDACYQEMQDALERQRCGEARVIPILLRPCDWGHTPLAMFRCLPSNGEAISAWGERMDEAFLDIVQGLSQHLEQSISLSRMSNADQHNRTELLTRVQRIWIEGLLNQSLYEAVRLDLHLQDQPDALANPWHFQVQELQHPPRSLAIDTNIIDVYDEASGELLILGEPGAGKTTLLLELARVLLQRARNDLVHPIPVIFNLSSWAKKQLPLATWLVEELDEKYQIHAQIGRPWIDGHHILPLLDGLDEVARSVRDACAQAICAYALSQEQRAGTPLIVCCRSQEYTTLSTRFPFSKAVYILPLTDAQVEQYLRLAGSQLEALREALLTDSELANLAHRPLMLSVISLAYQNATAMDIPSERTLEATTHAIFAKYVERMLNRRGYLSTGTKQQFRQWLTYLASNIQQRQQSVFLIEELQPNWLSDTTENHHLPSSDTPFWLLIRLASLLIAEVQLMKAVSEDRKPFHWKLAIHPDANIRPAETLSWSWKITRLTLLISLLGGLLIGLLNALILGSLSGSFLGLLGGVVLGLLNGPFSVLSVRQLTEHFDLVPNEGIWRSGKNGLFVGLLAGPVVGLSFGLLSWPIIGLSFGLLNGLLGGLVFGLFSALLTGFSFGLSFGLGAFIQHFILRFLLSRSGKLPWDLVPFLDEAAERLLLRKVGGGYLFAHRLLLEYLASSHEEE